MSLRGLAVVVRLEVFALSLGLLACDRPTPGDLGEIVPSHWVDQDGRAFGRAELHGHVWIVAFLFTRCPMACPAMAERMAYMQTLLPAHTRSIRMLSVTVDPENDTPPVLAVYGERFHRDPALWTFVTGDTEPSFRSITAGYARASGSAHTFDHGSMFALVDDGGRVRGYYGKDDASLKRLFREADRLAAER